MSNEEANISEIVRSGDGDGKGTTADSASISSEGKGPDVNEERSKNSNGEAEPARKSSGGKSTPSPKPGSPALSRISSAIPIDQRKARADELRKKKVEETRKKEDDRRAAVAERKRRLDEEERKKREALLKKLEVNVTPQRRLASSKRDRPLSASMSNLQHLHKSSLVSRSVDISTKDEKPKTTSKDAGLPKRPSSAMSSTRRNRSLSGDPPHSSRKSSAGSSGSSDSKRGRPIEPKTRPSTVTRAPEMPPRPMSAMPSLGRQTKTKDERRSAPGLKKAPKVQALPGKPSIPSSSTPPQKSSQLSHKMPTKSKSASNISTNKPGTAASKPKDIKASNKDSNPPQKTHREITKHASKDTKGSSKEDIGKAGMASEEEAKKALAERRKKAKEEAEKKAVLDKEKKEEEERIAREEEEKRQKMIAEMEAERLRHEEQIRLEDEENMRKAAELREKREKEEREKLELEQKLREEEIERKAKEELARKAKEREITRQQEEAARLERRKRVEEIMKKVVSNKGDESAEGGSNEPRIDSPIEEEVNGESARDRVGKILQKAKGSDRFEEKNNNTSQEEEEQASNENGLDQNTVDNHSVPSLVVSSSVTIEEKKSIISVTMNGDTTSAESKTCLISTETKEGMENSSTDGQIQSENQLWQSAEETMLERKALIQDALESKGIHANEGDESTEEGKLWQVAEGRIELEECF